MSAESQRESSNTERPTLRTFYFEIELKLTDEELAQAGGDAVQAAQNAIGHTGASVICDCEA